MQSHNSKIKMFVEDNLAAIPPVPCDFKVGDTVTFTNEAGVVFRGYKIIGFERELNPDFRPESFIYLDWASYWYATSPSTLKLEGNESLASLNSDVEDMYFSL